MAELRGGSAPHGCQIAAGVKTSERAKRLTGVPTIGPVGASAIDAMLPDPQLFRSGRDFAAWVALTPREDRTGKTIKRGPIAKKGDGYLRRLLVLGATSYLARVRRGQAKGASAWVLKMAAHPKRKLAAVALANRRRASPGRCSPRERILVRRPRWRCRPPEGCGRRPRSGQDKEGEEPRWCDDERSRRPGPRHSVPSS